MRIRLFAAVTISVVAGAVVAACSGSDTNVTATNPEAGTPGRSAEPAGEACTSPAQCYLGVEAGAVSGEVTCLTKVTNGYCTHTCAGDTECCAVPGECRTNVKQVCSSFENQDKQYCFLSCEDEDIAKAIAANSNDGFYDGGATDAASRADAYCRSFAGVSTSCRSSGGGSKNRKVCLPNE
jgi:hypothetical protein